MGSIEIKPSFNFEKMELLHFGKLTVNCDHPVLFMERENWLNNGSFPDPSVMSPQTSHGPAMSIPKFQIAIDDL